MFSATLTHTHPTPVDQTGQGPDSVKLFAYIKHVCKCQFNNTVVQWRVTIKFAHLTLLISFTHLISVCTTVTHFNPVVIPHKLWNY